MNRLMRMVIRFVMQEGASRGVDWLARRREKKIDPDAPGADQMRRQSRKQSQMIKRSLRMMRRLFRF